MISHQFRCQVRLGAAFIAALFLTNTAALAQHDRDSFCIAPLDGRAWSFDGEQLLLTGGESKEPDLWDLKTGTVIRTFHGHTEPVWEVALSPDGTTAATGAAGNPLTFKLSTDHSIRLWDIGLWPFLREHAGCGAPNRHGADEQGCGSAPSRRTLRRHT